jgi:hypothetical protein
VVTSPSREARVERVNRKIAACRAALTVERALVSTIEAQSLIPENLQEAGEALAQLALGGHPNPASRGHLKPGQS